MLDKRRQEAGRLFVVVNAPQAKFLVSVRCARPVYLRFLFSASFCSSLYKETKKQREKERKRDEPKKDANEGPFLVPALLFVAA